MSALTRSAARICSEKEGAQGILQLYYIFVLGIFYGVKESVKLRDLTGNYRDIFVRNVITMK